jgi:hypothetical protein
MYRITIDGQPKQLKPAYDVRPADLVFQPEESTRIVGPFGQLDLYELYLPSFLIRHQLFSIQKDVDARIVSTDRRIELFVPLTEYSQNVEKIGETEFQPFEYGVLYAPRLIRQTLFKQGHHYRTISISMSESTFRKIAPNVQLFQQLRDKADRGTAFYYSPPRHFSADTDLQSDLLNILYCQYRHGLRSIYLESVVKTFLISALDSLAKAYLPVLTAV